jgi:hypothetical protein
MSCNSRKVISTDDLDPSVFRKILSGTAPNSAWLITISLSNVNFIETDPIFRTWAQTYSAGYQQAYQAIQAGITPQNLSLDQNSGNLSISNGNTINIAKIESTISNSFLPNEYIFFKTSLSGTISFNVDLPVGQYFTYSYMDNISTVVTTLQSTTIASFSSSNYAPKDIYLWRSNNFGTPDGNSFEFFKCNNSGLIALDTSKVTNLKTLNLQNNLLDDFSQFFNPTITSLNLSNNRFTNLNLDRVTNLVTLNISGNSITNLNLNNNINIVEVFCQGNALVSLNMSGISLGGNGLLCSGNNLNATSLDNLYTQLSSARVNGTVIDVRGNPGTSSHTPSIATSKNYNVIT